MSHETSLQVYDTTLRDGAQGEGVHFSIEEKLAVAERLDQLGFHYIEAGWPASNPKDEEFFARARDLKLRHARLVAFGAAGHPRYPAQDDPGLAKLLSAGTPVVTIFGKSSESHAKAAYNVGKPENLKVIREAISWLKAQGREVIYDAEHFFDAFGDDPAYALDTVAAAEAAGADVIVLCDTKGGSLPEDIAKAVQAARKRLKGRLGIHAHNDCDLAAANTLAAVGAGATLVHGTVNGYGERCGNANLCSVIPVLELKMKRHILGAERLGQLRAVARFVSGVANLPLRSDMPFVGRSAFAHKAGLHIQATLKDSTSYEHVDPETVGNATRVLVSVLAGRASLQERLKELGIKDELDSAHTRELVRMLQELDAMGYDLEGVDGTLELLAHQARDVPTEFFRLEEFRVSTEKQFSGPPVSEATLKLNIGGRHYASTAHNAGPVHAIDDCLRQSLSALFPAIRSVQLTDYKVRVLGNNRGTASRCEVLVVSTDGERSWTTVGVSENILEASWQALADSYRLWLTRESLREPSVRQAAHDYCWGV